MKGSTALIISGAIALIAGIVALVFPLPASLAVAMFVAWGFVFSGVMGLWAVFSNAAVTNRGWMGLLSLANLVLGIWMLARPLEGMISLTIAVGILFLASGISRVLAAMSDLRGRRMMWPMALSGVISVALGLYILLALPAASVVTLSALLAIELAIVGSTLLMAGFAAKRLASLNI